jgi:hypothetical protein
VLDYHHDWFISNWDKETSDQAWIRTLSKIIEISFWSEKKSKVEAKQSLPVWPYIILCSPSSLLHASYYPAIMYNHFIGIATSDSAQQDQSIEHPRGHSPVIQAWSTPSCASNMYKPDTHRYDMLGFSSMGWGVHDWEYSSSLRCVSIRTNILLQQDNLLTCRHQQNTLKMWCFLMSLKSLEPLEHTWAYLGQLDTTWFHFFCFFAFSLKWSYSIKSLTALSSSPQMKISIIK